MSEIAPPEITHLANEIVRPMQDDPISNVNPGDVTLTHIASGQWLVSWPVGGGPERTLYFTTRNEPLKRADIKAVALEKFEGLKAAADRALLAAVYGYSDAGQELVLTK